MTTRFNRMGFKVPVTLISAEPNVVLANKENRVVIGMGKRKTIKKTDAAYVKSAGYTPRYIKEVKLVPAESGENKSELKSGQSVTVSIFELGDEVKVTGTTKGRGFAGVIKRHGFHGGPKTHGQSDRHRAPGSIGAGTTPGRVYKGKRMAGHMGAANYTVTGLEIIEIDNDKNLLFIKGAIPGARKGFVIVEKTGKVKGYTPPPAPNEEKLAEKEERAEEETKKVDEVENQTENKTEQKKEVQHKEGEVENAS